MRAHFIDVGQGACTLLEFPTGAILVDTGGQDDEQVDSLCTYLARFFQSRSDLQDTLQLVVVSHPHVDHSRGLQAVAEQCRVVGYVDNGNVTGSGKKTVNWIRESVANMERSTIIRPVRDSEITVLPAKTGITDSVIDPLDDVECDPHIVVLSGGMDEDPGWGDDMFANQNNHSVVLRVDFGESSFLFTGDLEEPAIETLVEYYAGTGMLDVDVYQVGHHGSHNATTPNLLAAVSPEYAMIGVGRWDFGQDGGQFTTFRFGHPRRATIDLLSATVPGVRTPPIQAMVADGMETFRPYAVTQRIFATGWDGTFVLTANSDGEMSVETHVAESNRAAAPSASVARLDKAGPRPRELERVVERQPISLRIVGWNLESGESAIDLLAEQLAEKQDVQLFGLSEVSQQGAIQHLEQAADSASGRDYGSILGTTGGDDRLAILYDNTQLELVGDPQELMFVQLRPGLQAPLVAEFRGKRTDQRFLFMVNHLKRGNAQNPDRLKQSELLNAWAKLQELPVIAVGDYNYDFDVELGNAGFPHRDRGFDALVKDGAFVWVQPDRLLKTNADDDFNTVLDFAFVANPQFGWSAASRILDREGDRPAVDNDFDDDDTNSDHRPVEVILTFAGDRRERSISRDMSAIESLSREAPRPPPGIESPDEQRRAALLERLERLEAELRALREELAPRTP